MRRNCSVGRSRGSLPAGLAGGRRRQRRRQSAGDHPKFAAKESEFREARNNYTYRQTVKIKILDAAGNPTGEKWEQVADVIFTPEGKRVEKVVYAPVSTLQQISC